MRPAILVFLALFVSACDPLPPEAPASQDAPLAEEPADADPRQERLTLRAAGRTFREVRLEGERLWGARHEIQHSSDGYRGKLPSGFLFLSQKEDRYVSGIIG